MHHRRNQGFVHITVAPNTLPTTAVANMANTPHRVTLAAPTSMGAPPIRAATFAVGAGVPIVTILLAPATALVLAVSIVSLLCLVALGAVAARIGGAPMLVGAARVTMWGVLAMLVTAAVGRAFGATVT